MAGCYLLRRAPSACGALWRSCQIPNLRTCRTFASKMEPGEKPVLRGVVFDMDGTLLKPVIDFAEMRRRVGLLPHQGDILDVINKWPDDERARAYATIAEIEEQALRDMALMPGALELCAFLDQQGLPRGLITRNVRRSVQYFHDFLGLVPFQPAITRECEFPYKPSPAALHHIASSWRVEVGQVLMVGDSVKDDVVSGNRAGAVTVLLDYSGEDTADGSGNNGAAAQRRRPESFEGEQRPTHVVGSLMELQELLESSYTLVPPPP
ncbi:hypothetical protein PLESTB_000451400 [Pleodorina starrii]|uniref:Uncharacterized protein n=1 Tax=Pleodorina starrii TaxID=330485 RepID=A0A9W6BFT1_9CHLO|nr:hypothetical protein PLESTM_000752800 [Pleodorina starrii]GLC50963.1 hypothetical protein PLESTB_000451400 [Pleodorina starrii]